jgi:hypothetical protein
MFQYVPQATTRHNVSIAHTNAEVLVLCNVIK